jgi:hypothetical protein
LKRLA